MDNDLKEGDKLRLTASPNPDGGNHGRDGHRLQDNPPRCRPPSMSPKVLRRSSPNTPFRQAARSHCRSPAPSTARSITATDTARNRLNLNPATGSLINYEYAEAGRLRSIRIRFGGTALQPAGHSETSRSCLTAVKQWGNVNTTSMYYAYHLCSNLKTLPENTTDCVRRGNHVQILPAFRRLQRSANHSGFVVQRLRQGHRRPLGCFHQCAFAHVGSENLLAPLKNVTSLQSPRPLHSAQNRSGRIFRPKPLDHDAEIHLLRKYEA